MPLPRPDLTRRRMRPVSRIIAFVASSLLLSCAPDHHSVADRQFESLANNLIESYLQLHPEEATSLGDHRFDAMLNDYSREGIQTGISLRERYLDSLNSIKVEELSHDNRIDYDVFRHNLEKDLFSLRELREWESNPLVYNIGNAVYNLIARAFAPLHDRMTSLEGRLKAIPKVFEHARKNLRNPPALHAQTAIQQNEGNITLLTETLAPFIDSLPEARRASFLDARDKAVEALRSYIDWMKAELLPSARGNFRLGRDIYDRKLRYSLDTDLTREEILAAAGRDLESTTNELHALAGQLWGKYFPDVPVPQDKPGLIRTVLNRLAKDRPTNSTIVEQAGKAMEDAEAFVRSHNIVSLPTEPLKIIVMPEFQRGIAVAYCESPGPLEKDGETFYAISPTPKDWPASRVESFYREYNDHMLRNLTVHEAMPGHYLQLMAGNKFKASTMLRGIFHSGIFAEGWATYAEQVMADAGFGGPEMKMQQLKMRLRLIINAIIDQKIHTAGMTEKEAMDLMMIRGFQEVGEAAGKWRRACLTSTQLSTYYVGNMLFNDLRRRYEGQQGAKFSMKDYHDKVLSFGTISPKYLPTLLKLPVETSPTPPALSHTSAHR